MVILFNEIVNPLSVKQSIRINGQNDFSIRVKYNKVIIYPLDKWDDIVELTISRNISDYQNNIMEAPVSKIFKIESMPSFCLMKDKKCINTFKGADINGIKKMLNIKD